MNTTNKKSIVNSQIHDRLYSKESPVTPLQSGAFNALLTNVAKHIRSLQNAEDLPVFIQTLTQTYEGYNNDNTDTPFDFETVIHNWQILLNHLNTILLPELYVFFHDDTCTTQQRLMAHESIEKLWQACKIWQIDDSNHPKYSPLEKQIIKQNCTQTHQSDDYIIGKGTHADIACRTLPLAKLSDIKGFDYLVQLDPLLQLLTATDSLTDFLSSDSKEMVDSLNHWLKQRLSTFSIPSAEQLDALPSFLKLANLHPLTAHIQQNSLLAEIQPSVQSDTVSITPPSGYTQDVLPTTQSNLSQSGNADFATFSTDLPLSDLQDAKLNSNEQASELSVPESNNMIASKAELTKGCVLLAVGLALSLYPAALLVHIILTVVALPFLVIAPINLADGLITLRTQKTYRLVGTALLLSPLLLVAGVPFGAVLSSFILGLCLRIKSKHKEQLALTQRHNIDYKNGNKLITKEAITSNDDNDNSVLLPIKVYPHASYLIKLLSKDSSKLLQELIKAINEAHGYLDYLEEHHSYLATSVHELIMDLTINSILRLDKIAQKFITGKVVNDEIKTLFANNHENNIVELFSHNLAEVTELNTSILEKQMAGFSTVGSDAEIKFRNSIMELRILLNWFVAQSPNNEDASSYAVILDRLESKTLKQMQEVFYKHDTNETQRTDLQLQIEELLVHFQSQSPKAKHQDSGSDLLKLSDGSADYLQTSETQSFIDFNKQYVKQLKTHWH